jgi:hypothetical protein
MSLIVTILGQRKYEPVLKIPGLSTKNFTFKWDKSYGKYVYEAHSQEDVDDIMETQQFSTFYRFSVIMPKASSVAPGEVIVREVIKEVIKEVPVEGYKLTVRDRPPLPFTKASLETKSREELKAIATQYNLGYTPALKIDALIALVAAFIAGYDGQMPQ